MYNHFAPKMYALCLRYAADTEDAKDILQEGFIAVFSKLPSFRGQGSLEGWIRRIMVNIAIDRYRDRIYHLSLDDIHENGLMAFDNLGPASMEAKQILALIRDLPDQYRLVFNLYVIEGYSHREIGQMLSISESTSRSNLSRARGLLQERMKLVAGELIRVN